MAGALRKTMAYLGLSEADVEEYGTRSEGPEWVDRAVDDEPRAEVTRMPRPAVVREPEVPEELRRIATVHPTTYNEARVIGEAFRDGTPVIMNLSGMTESDAKRMVDFAAGLVFGLHGVIERVTNRVFLLSPATVEVAGESAEPAAQSRFFNQS